MGTNSIRANLSKDDIISEIRLSLGADIKQEHTFLVVEGEDDLKFWKNIANEKVILFESFTGKTGITEIVEEYFTSNPRVIGIRDRDYECGHIYNKIFYYDCCCMEMMLVKNDEVFNNIYSEYYSGRLSSNELRDVLLKQLKYLSLIRKNNETMGLGIKIDGVSITNAFDEETQNIQNEKIILKLNQMNQQYFAINVDKLSQINSQNAIVLNTEELLEINQGHDFIELFAAFCRKPRGSSASSKNIAASLRCAYRKRDFTYTELYLQLVSYSNTHNIVII
ncbi:DUF4435 domain-containing protein [Clostridiaceae bacterium UIB06]|uniref:DUF4435 domain-containing protein n=1 Tax=Clostridium thailandense TaxID=2794346 RepID=A0A949WPQ6_9CLOT|nr:DUF4435 domain-containing protein [Clostridium thailandense]MBV7271625.1 DUF4435 domain-containing protein [Clostridium thailandense]MCH5136405.1 DUF4435 domain-containing protein [Clostridiaceae bacterium UIB06]